MKGYKMQQDHLAKFISNKELIEKCSEKFKRGAEEHKSDWTKVNHIAELQEELIDAVNYAVGALEYNSHICKASARPHSLCPGCRCQRLLDMLSLTFEVAKTLT